MPNVFTTKIRQAGLMIVGGLLTASGIYAGTNITTGGTSLPEVSNAGAESVKVFIANNEFNAAISATGAVSSGVGTQRYAAVCIPNPLTKLPVSGGTGGLIRLSVEMGNNPAGVGGDVYFTKDCGDNTTTGSTLILNDTCTSTGCVSYYTTGTALWNGVDFIKLTFRANPTASVTGRVRGAYEDVFGE